MQRTRRERIRLRSSFMQSANRHYGSADCGNSSEAAYARLAMKDQHRNAETLTEEFSRQGDYYKTVETNSIIAVPAKYFFSCSTTECRYGSEVSVTETRSLLAKC